MLLMVLNPFVISCVFSPAFFTALSAVWTAVLSLGFSRTFLGGLPLVTESEQLSIYSFNAR